MSFLPKAESFKFLFGHNDLMQGTFYEGGGFNPLPHNLELNNTTGEGIRCHNLYHIFHEKQT